MYYRWIEWQFDLHDLGKRWVDVNDMTVFIVTMAQGGPF